MLFKFLLFTGKRKSLINIVESSVRYLRCVAKGRNQRANSSNLNSSLFDRHECLSSTLRVASFVMQRLAKCLTTRVVHM